ncbi:MAG: hypothetical protein QOJ73_452, partial [Streptosporangiaceae bacterium]|nr:hypothetical protein [Streptosporangiaceae bacterium]
MSLEDRSARINHDAARPLWQQVADDLRADITAGRLAAGVRLPAEHELAAQYGCRIMLRNHRHLSRWQRSRQTPASVALHGPHRGMGGLQCLVDGIDQVRMDRVQIQCVLQARGECGDCLVRVIPTRLNRRSTVRCTRWRSGLKSAGQSAASGAGPDGP